MRQVTLVDLYTDSVCRKHLPRAGIDHSIRVAELALELATKSGVAPDLAAADDALEETEGYHHRRELSYREGLERVRKLDERVEALLAPAAEAPHFPT